MHKKTWLEKAIKAYEIDLATPLINIVDIGSSGTPPTSCQDLAAVSTYLGFDPDLREPQSGNEFGFSQYTTLNKAITASQDSTVQFYLTEYPQCSSTLIPVDDEVKKYAIGNFFNVVGKENASAIRLDTALSQSGRTRIDWLKLDTQGTDYDILKSLDLETQKELLVVDLEPGITAFYKNENRFSDIHEFMLNNGFWLAGLDQQQFPRISTFTVEKLGLTDTEVIQLGSNPFAVELQYFRTIESLRDHHRDEKTFFAMWLLAMTNGRYAFAIETALAGEKSGMAPSLSQTLVSITLEVCQRKQPLSYKDSLKKVSNAILPPIISDFIRRLRSFKLRAAPLKQAH